MPIMERKAASIQSTEQMLSGWGNYPVEQCQTFRPATREALCSIVNCGEQSSYIPRGLGRSYGDSSLNRQRGVIINTHFDRFLSFDEQSGVLACEAGVSLATIIQHLLPRGWFLPTTPGTKYVTVGGAIASDVHGKNHHVSGSFGNFVLDLTLLTASGAVLLCSPNEQADIFWATIGGMGLTGVILSARIQLVKVESAYAQVAYRKTKNLDETLDSFAVDHEYRYSVAWIDCLASGSSLGRSVLMLGNDATAADLPAPLARTPLTLPLKRQVAVPFFPPGILLNSWSAKVFNTLYYRNQHNGIAIVDYDTFFYPLDRVLHWNRLYGRRGFVQYQAFFPPETARRGLGELLETIGRFKKASFFAVLKQSGPASRGILSFLSPGYTLALDFPYDEGNLQQLLQELDRVLLKHDGRLYMAKDATTTAEVFAEMYPELRKFAAIKARIDPNNRFASSQARRLGIVEAI